MNNTEIAYTPANASWLNRIEAQLTALRYFALDGTDHLGARELGVQIRSIWRAAVRAAAGGLAGNGRADQRGDVRAATSKMSSWTWGGTGRYRVRRRRGG